ncbi:9716_t:CDS:1, partial [Acaulospora colombiana]
MAYVNAIAPGGCVDPSGHIPSSSQTADVYSKLVNVDFQLVKTSIGAALKVTVIAGVVAATYVVAEVIKLFVKPLFSSHRRLRGPPSASLIFGHMLVEADIAVSGEKYHPQELWRREYGHIFKTNAFM